MLSHPELVFLSRVLRDQRVLSVYVGGAGRDPAAADGWRVRLRHELHALRRSLAGATHDERESFERCVAMIERRTAELPDGIGAPGWVAFTSVEGVQHASTLPAPMPTMATWGTGIRIAPYFRALKQETPVVIVIADSTKASLFRYRRGVLAPAGEIGTPALTEPGEFAGDVPHQRFHQGVRGVPATDAVQRMELERTRRLSAEIVARVEELAGIDAWIVVGGAPSMRAALVRELSEIAPGRVHRAEGLDAHATLAQVRAAAAAGASTLRDAWDGTRLVEMIEGSASSGLAALGPVETRDAVDQRRVRELYLTPSMVDTHREDIEQLVRDAVDQGALVEEVSRQVADALDEHGGVAARLRFRLDLSARPAARHRHDAAADSALQR